MIEGLTNLQVIGYTVTCCSLLIIVSFIVCIHAIGSYLGAWDVNNKIESNDYDDSHYPDDYTKF